MKRRLGDFDPHNHSLVLDEAEIQELAGWVGRRDVDWTGALASMGEGKKVDSLWVTTWSTPYSLHAEYEQII